MAYIPNSNSVVAFQSDATKLNATTFQQAGSVMAVSGSFAPAANQSVSGDVYALQKPGSVLAVSGSFSGGNSSVQIVGGTAMVGSIAAYQGATAPWRVELTSGSIITTAGATTPSSVQLLGGSNVIGSVTALQGNNPWKVELTSGSVLSTTGNSSVQIMNGTAMIGSIAAYQGSKPWSTEPTSGSVFAYQAAGSVMAVSGSFSGGNSSVQLLGSNAMIGSVAAYQGATPWKVELTSGSVLSTTGNSSVQLLGGSNVIGSVTALQGTNPWLVQNVTSVMNQYREDTLGSSVVGVAMMFKRTDSASLMSAISPQYPLPTVGSVSGTVTTNANPSSVQVIAGTNVIGSVAVLQGTSPWLITGSVLATGNSSVQLVGSNALIGSVAQAGNWFMQPSSVQLMAGTNVVGSVAVLQGTSPWLITGSVLATGNSSVQLVGSNALIGSVAQAGNWFMQPASVQLMAGTNNIGSVTAVQGTNPWGMSFTPASLISGHASTVNASSGSVLVLASVQATLNAYITDFLISNTGAATTLVTFTDSDGSIMGKTIAPTGGGAVAAAFSSPMKTLSTGKAVYMGASTATSTLHAWVGGYKAL